MSRTPRILALLLVLIAPALPAHAQDRLIVTDPALNARLLAFEQAFPQFVADHPAMSAGATQPIALEGQKGKITVELAMSGEYAVVYDAIRFDPVDPIAPDRFTATLTMRSIQLSGDATVVVTKKSKTWTLDCQDTTFAVAPAAFSAEVQVAADGRVSLSNPVTVIDPKTIEVSVPCLTPQRKADGGPSADDLAGLDLAPIATKALEAALSPGATPNGNVRRGATTAVTGAAHQSSSDVSETSETTGTSTGTAATSAGASPCGGTVQATVSEIVADLQAISAQADAQGFDDAMSAFGADVQAILPALSAPDQALVETFLLDLEYATSEESQAGVEISVMEQASLTIDLYNVVMSTGITEEQVATIVSDLEAVAGTLAGISTTELQADVQRLVAELQTCAQQ